MECNYYSEQRGQVFFGLVTLRAYARQDSLVELFIYTAHCVPLFYSVTRLLSPGFFSPASTAFHLCKSNYFVLLVEEKVRGRHREAYASLSALSYIALRCIPFPPLRFLPVRVCIHKLCRRGKASLKMQQR